MGPSFYCLIHFYKRACEVQGGCLLASITPPPTTTNTPLST